jgi:hypothetical protein
MQDMPGGRCIGDVALLPNGQVVVISGVQVRPSFLRS